MAALETRKAHLTTEVVELLKQNREVLEVAKKDKVEVDALKIEVDRCRRPWIMPNLSW